MNPVKVAIIVTEVTKVIIETQYQQVSEGDKQKHGIFQNFIHIVHTCDKSSYQSQIVCCKNEYELGKFMT